MKRFLALCLVLVGLIGSVSAQTNHTLIEVGNFYNDVIYEYNGVNWEHADQEDDACITNSETLQSAIGNYQTTVAYYNNLRSYGGTGYAPPALPSSLVLGGTSTYWNAIYDNWHDSSTITTSLYLYVDAAAAKDIAQGSWAWAVFMVDQHPEWYTSQEKQDQINLAYGDVATWKSKMDAFCASSSSAGFTRRVLSYAGGTLHHEERDWLANKAAEIANMDCLISAIIFDLETYQGFAPLVAP